MITNETFELNNGVTIPKLGLGTWFINNKDVKNVVVDAIHTGYRHIDTASAYRNEGGVGEGIREAGIRRQDIFVTTKLSAGAKTYKKAVSSIDASLKRMKLDYVDLMIIHSPRPWSKFSNDDPYFEGNLEAWRALEEAYQAGKIKAIGLSNFEKRDIDNILRHGTVKPAVNQILAHIGNMPFELIDYTKSQGILVEAYSPVAHGVLLNNETVKEIAAKYGVSAPQLCIRYDLQHDLLPLPKTSNKKHMQSNATLDFVISEEDMQALDSIEPVTDYGDANMMPVYGGQMNLKTMLSMIKRAMK